MAVTSVFLDISSTDVCRNATPGNGKVMIVEAV